jgi:hypothetical protein
LAMNNIYILLRDVALIEMCGHIRHISQTAERNV